MVNDLVKDINRFSELFKAIDTLPFSAHQALQNIIKADHLNTLIENDFNNLIVILKLSRLETVNKNWIITLDKILLRALIGNDFNNLILFLNCFEQISTKNMLLKEYIEQEKLISLLNNQFDNLQKLLEILHAAGNAEKISIFNLIGQEALNELINSVEMLDSVFNIYFEYAIF